MPAMKIAGNFFLIGLMGAGKTTIGRALARRLNKTFYDSDHEIELRTGVRIATIFDIEGERRFREREASSIADLLQQEDIVLATGGGAVLHADTRRLLHLNGTVIYLRASAHDLYLRTKHDKSRPLLNSNNPQLVLSNLFKERDPIYSNLADIIIDTAQQSVIQVVNLLELRLLDINKLSSSKTFP